MSEDKMVSGELIRQTTKRYAEQHSLCEVVDDYLEDLGLDPVCGRDMTVTVRLAVQMDVNIIVNELEWVSLMEDEQKEMLHKGLYFDNNVRVYARNDIVELPSHYAVPELAGVILNPSREGTPIGYMARFASYDGRVLHYYPIGATDMYYSLCGRANTGVPRATSDRDEGRVCSICEKRGADLNGAAQ